MLVLTRKRGEGIILPDQGITITVLNVKPGGAVRIGVDADRSICVMREEVTNGAEGRKAKDKRK